MRQSVVIIAVLAGLFVLGGVLGANHSMFGSVLNQRHSVPSPLASCSPATAEQAHKLAATIVDALNRLDEAPLKDVFDLDTLIGLSIYDLQLSDRERRDFILGAVNSSKQKNQIAARWITDLGKPDRARLVRIAQIDGHQRAMVRMLIGDAITYMDLLIARTTNGQVRVMDFFDVASGDFFSRTLTSIVLPSIANMTRTPLERLVSGTKDETLLSTGKLKEVRALLDEGKAKESMALFITLPDSFRSTRIGMLMRIRIAQGIDDQAYLAALDEIERRFPGDPTLALVQIDAHLLRKRHPQALAAIDLVDEKVGGDPYLDAMRANVHTEAGDLVKAVEAAERACQREPDLIDVWWMNLSVSLKAGTHARTGELLDEVQRRFSVEFEDLNAVPEYAGFVASPQYGAWLARQPKPAPVKAPAAPVKPLDPNDVPGSVIALISNRLGTDKPVLATSNLAKDLGADELDIAEILMDLEDAFQIQITESEPIVTVGDAIRIVERKRAQ